MTAEVGGRCSFSRLHAGKHPEIRKRGGAVEEGSKEGRGYYEVKGLNPRIVITFCRSSFSRQWA